MRAIKISDVLYGTCHNLTYLYFMLHAIKGTVQRELRGVKIGINRFLLMYSPAGKCPLPCPKGHHHERSINVISGFSTFLRHLNRLG
jgi:hypothetical protein